MCSELPALAVCWSLLAGGFRPAQGAHARACACILNLRSALCALMYCPVRHLAPHALLMSPVARGPFAPPTWRILGMRQTRCSLCVKRIGVCRKKTLSSRLGDIGRKIYTCGGNGQWTRQRIAGTVELWATSTRCPQSYVPLAVGQTLVTVEDSALRKNLRPPASTPGGEEQLQRSSNAQARN